jgi:hypothetical protein
MFVELAQMDSTQKKLSTLAVFVPLKNVAYQMQFQILAKTNKLDVDSE